MALQAQRVASVIRTLHYIVAGDFPSSGDARPLATQIDRSSSDQSAGPMVHFQHLGHTEVAG